MPDDHIEPPATIKEVGIHIGYLREDMRQLKEAVEKLPNGFATKVEVNALELRVASLEKKGGVKNTVQWVALSVTTIISIIGLYNMFGRK